MKSTRGGFRMLRHEQLLQERVHDTYKSKRKIAEGTGCSECGAVYGRGRWRWEAVPGAAHKLALCPACRRIQDRMPAGYIELKGTFQHEHRGEVINRVRGCEALERREHPLQRIMAIEPPEPESDALLVTTTDTHLARRIGEALHDAFKGEVEYRYNKEDNVLRVCWSR